MNAAKRDELRRVLNSLIGIRGKDNKSLSKPGNAVSRIVNERDRALGDN